MDHLDFRASNPPDWDLFRDLHTADVHVEVIGVLVTELDCMQAARPRSTSITTATSSTTTPAGSSAVQSVHNWPQQS